MAVWLLGYVVIYSPIQRSELEDSLAVEDKKVVIKNIGDLEEAGLIERNGDRSARGIKNRY